MELDVNPTRKKQTPKKISLYKKADWDRLWQHMEDVSTKIRETVENSSTEEMRKYFKDGYQMRVHEFIPPKKTKSRDSSPFLTRLKETG